MDIKELLCTAVLSNASDIFIVAGQPITFSIHDKISTVNSDKLYPGDTENLIRQIYTLAGGRSMDTLLKMGSDDFAFSIPHVSRFRVNAYKQRSSLAAVIRTISFTLPDPKTLNIPETILSMANKQKGLVLVTGPAGSGKSTTLACLVDKINTSRQGHIITLEEPLEFLHSHKQCIVSQREIYIDSPDYLSALRAALRQRPNVILLGELRDLETISVAMTAAETGHLVLSSLHTIGASSTIDRILDVFPPNQQKQITVQLAMSLQCIVSQQLLPTVDGNLTPAFEVLTVNAAVRNMIRENKIHQIDNIIMSSSSEDMISMDNSILKLFRNGEITEATALTYATSPDLLARRLRS